MDTYRSLWSRRLGRARDAQDVVRVLVVGPFFQFGTAYEDEVVVRGEVDRRLGEAVETDHDRDIGSMVKVGRS